MNWVDRLKFWLWHFWLEHPILFIIMICVPFGFFYARPRGEPREPLIVSEDISVGEVISRHGDLNRRGRYQPRIRVRKADGIIQDFSLHIDEWSQCVPGSTVKLQKVGPFERLASNQCIPPEAQTEQ